jgi:hypothetical protein
MKVRRLLIFVAVLSGVAAVAAVGRAFADSRSASNVVSACVHVRGGVLYLARKCAGHDRRVSWGATGPAGAPGAPGAVGPPGPPGAQGVPGAPGAAASTLFAQVAPDGRLGAATAGIQVDKVGLGTYELDFGRDITRCVASVQQGGIPTGRGGSTGSGDGAAHASIFGAGAAFPNGFATGDTVLVSTIDHGGLSDSSFQLAIVC